MPDRTPFLFYNTVELKQNRTYVTLSNLCRTLGFEFITNLDQCWPSLSFYAREFYLSSISRGNELQFNFEAVKTAFDQAEFECWSTVKVVWSSWTTRNLTNFWRLFRKHDREDLVI